jgi:hypothetical protein
MRASRKDQENRNQEKGNLEAAVNKNALQRGSEEVEGIFEDTNENVTKTFKHLGKVETKF